MSPREKPGAEASTEREEHLWIARLQPTALFRWRERAGRFGFFLLVALFFGGVWWLLQAASSPFVRLWSILDAPWASDATETACEVLGPAFVESHLLTAAIPALVLFPFALLGVLWLPRRLVAYPEYPAEVLFFRDRIEWSGKQGGGVRFELTPGAPLAPVPDLRELPPLRRAWRRLNSPPPVNRNSDRGSKSSMGAGPTLPARPSAAPSESGGRALGWDPLFPDTLRQPNGHRLSLRSDGAAPGSERQPARHALPERTISLC